MITVEHVKGHIDILKYVKEQQAMTCCIYLSSWRLARSYSLQSEPENTVTFNRPSP
jgi:hypothetical protein